MDLVQDVGYEGAYNYLGRKLVGLPSRHHALCSAASSQQQGPPPLMFKDSLWNLPPDMLAKYLPKDAAAMVSLDQSFHCYFSSLKEIMPKCVW